MFQAMHSVNPRPTGGEPDRGTGIAAEARRHREEAKKGFRQMGCRLVFPGVDAEEAEDAERDGDCTAEARSRREADTCHCDPLAESAREFHPEALTQPCSILSSIVPIEPGQPAARPLKPRPSPAIP